MLDIKLTGTFPTIPEDIMPKVMQEVGEYQKDFVLQTLMMGGRTPWTLRKTDGGIRYSGTRMASTVRMESNESSASVIAGEGMVSSRGFFYPRVLHEGYTVPEVSGKLMVFTIGGQTIFTQRHKKFTVGPAPFMMFLPENVEHIHKLVPDAILRGIRHERVG